MTESRYAWLGHGVRSKKNRRVGKSGGITESDGYGRKEEFKEEKGGRGIPVVNGGFWACEGPPKGSLAAD